MKKLSKRIAAITAAMLLCGSVSVPAAVLKTAAISAEYSAGDGWVTENGVTYYLKDGKKLTGWQTIDGKKYYFYKSGKMAANTNKFMVGDTRYAFGKDGVCKKFTGFSSSDEGRSYWKKGKLVKNRWISVKGGKYYANKEGSLLINGKYTIDGVEYEFDKKGKLIPEPWGITLTAKDVTPSGLTLVITQGKGGYTGETMTGEDYTLERLDGGKWTPVEYITDSFGWDDIGLLISEAPEKQREDAINWEWLYGSLPAGRYRLCKEITDFRKTADFDKRMYYAYFDIQGDKEAAKGAPAVMADGSYGSLSEELAAAGIADFVNAYYDEKYYENGSFKNFRSRRPNDGATVSKIKNIFFDAAAGSAAESGASWSASEEYICLSLGRGTGTDGFVLIVSNDMAQYSSGIRYKLPEGTYKKIKSLILECSSVDTKWGMAFDRKDF